MTTISIKEDTRKKLLQIAGDLQRKTRRRADFDSVIRFLIDTYEENQINQEAWTKFTTPVPDVDFDSAYRDLLLERELDERKRQ